MVAAPVVEENTVEITPLGAGQEVGRSCILVKYMGKTVMLDCGVHPGYQGLRSLPYLDTVALDTVDLMLVTHFHLDHCAAVPYVTGHTNFKGKILMTHPTKAICGTLLKDFVKLGRGSAPEEQLFTEEDLRDSLTRIDVVDFHQTVDINGIKVCAYRAGHVLGAAMFTIEIGGIKVLYTGDYSRLADRHLSAADLPDSQPDVVIVEATYGVSKHLPREDREQRFLKKVRQALARGGRVLLPVVALGRAQELLLILEDHWNRSPDLQSVPIYQASGLASQSLKVYQTYIEMMNDAIKQAFQRANPFKFKHVKQLGRPRDLEGVGPCVVMATPSMLQSGLSRELFEAWCQDSRNGVIIADFAVQGTLAREILAAPEFIMTRGGARVPLKMSVDAISFSAHADFPQTSEFIDELQPQHVVLVHGEATEMGRLKRALEQRASATGQQRTLYMPRVTQPVQILHKTSYTAKVVGQLADKVASAGKTVQGLLVQQNRNDIIVDPDSLPAFTRLQRGGILQRQAVPLRATFSEARLALEVLFEGVEGSGNMGGVHSSGESEGAVRVGDEVTMTHEPSTSQAHGFAVLEWDGSARADMIADAIVATLMQLGDEPAHVTAAERARLKALADRDVEAVLQANTGLIAALLDCQYGNVTLNAKSSELEIQVDGHQLVVNCSTGKVESTNADLGARVEKSVSRMMHILKPVDVAMDL